MELVDIIAYSLAIGGVLATIAIIWSYAKGLKDSPRDMWILFIYKFIEYTAYGTMNMVLILWLKKDCGMGDFSAGSYIAAWSMMLSIMAMMVGALIDTIGIKKTLMLSIIFLLISRFFMAFVTNPILIYILGFIPLAIGFAIVGPLVSVAIKRYTTKEGAALGFGLFYVIMNIAFAVGAFLFDWFRNTFVEKDALGKIINENFGTYLMGIHFSTYQLIFIFGFLCTCISMVVVFFIRDGVEVIEGKISITPTKSHGSGTEAIKHATVETGKLINTVVREKYFWIYIGMLALTIPVRSIFFHFHYTFPDYGIRVLGEGAKIGNIYGVLNPVLVIFLVPLVAYFTKKTSSYKMMIIGSIVSSLSCFIVLFPEAIFSTLTNSIWGELIFIKWLGMADNIETLIATNPPSAAYWPLIAFITVFTIGEAIWSPRLMQFSAEIAPKGKEGTYIALSILPWFAAKFIVGPMSGLLLSEYVPVDEAGKAMASYPDHFMIWAWIGGMAILTPISLLLLKKWFKKQFVEGEDASEEKAEGTA